ncbi:hypothetical protein TNIN_359781 [Trichonephila inaurata madagascariensis]|uniref:Uncharacterized protein n=1 Tax=Trichonephila inaurata madagascariensis TaxID=2747483 RepID=A0A8X7CCK4_9ARAC|nr:hypothetical protein TNIN_359781 [Trichonephila inaurata madagascariensis]
MRRMQHGSKPSLRMVYEAFLRVGQISASAELAERLCPAREDSYPPAQKTYGTREFLLYLLNPREFLLYLLNPREFYLPAFRT